MKTPKNITKVDPARSAACKRAWITIRANRKAAEKAAKHRAAKKPAVAAKKPAAPAITLAKAA